MKHKKLKKNEKLGVIPKKLVIKANKGFGMLVPKKLNQTYANTNKPFDFSELGKILEGDTGSLKALKEAFEEFQKSMEEINQEENSEFDCFVDDLEDESPRKSELDTAVDSLVDYKSKCVRSRKMKKEKVAIFYGFNGKLKYQYSIVEAEEGKGIEEIRSRMSVIQGIIDIPWSVQSIEEWEKTVKNLDDQEFKEIPFADAMSIIRGGNYPKAVEKWEDSEEEEFTDKCTVECSPGDHKCGKK